MYKSEELIYTNTVDVSKESGIPNNKVYTRVIKRTKVKPKNLFRRTEKIIVYLDVECKSADEETISTNNDTVVVVSEDDFDDFFADDYEDYKKIMGKCFINEKIGIAVKILEILNDEYYQIEPYEFIYERCDNWIDGWNFEDYNWLQEQQPILPQA